MNKTSILGRILFFTFLPIFLFANVNLSLDKVAVLQGEAVVMTITASGDNIKFPQLRTVEGNKVLGTSTSSSIRIINGSMTRTKSISYQFIPKYTFNIPIFSVYIDGEEFRTEEIKLKVVKPTSSKQGDKFQLELKFDKTKAYVGEDIIVSMIFKYKVGLPVISLALEDFEIKHFVIKELEVHDAYEENSFIIVKKDYVVFPQLAGEYNIEKQLVNVKTRQEKTNQLIWEKVFSNEEKIEVLALPNGVNIQGDFKISASVDKSTTKANQPVNLTLKINGYGNIDDIEEFKLDMDNEVVYSTKPQIQARIQRGKYSGVFTQKHSIIADSDFTIPEISFKYFDINTKTVKTIKTKEIKVKVKGVAKEAPSIQTANQKQEVKTIQLPPKIIIEKEDSYIKYLFGGVGIILGLLLSYFITSRKTKKEVIKPLEVKIKKSKNDKELYSILLPYSYNSAITEILNLLEDNIYNNKNNKITKKEILQIVDEWELV